MVSLKKVAWCRGTPKQRLDYESAHRGAGWNGSAATKGWEEKGGCNRAGQEIPPASGIPSVLVDPDIVVR
jgi:hypothetical protein